jgi:hypothetical protein
MIFAGINYLAVVVAALASFGFGAVYYVSLAKQWMAAIGKTEEQLKAQNTRRIYIISAIAELIMAWMVAGVLGHLGDGQVTILNGVLSAIFLWFGFVLTTIVVNHGYQGAKPAQTAIDAGHWLGVLIVQGLVIGAFGV